MKVKGNPFGLTDRQLEVMQAMARLGCSKQVAYEQSINKKVVDEIIRRAMKKIGASNRIVAVLTLDRHLRAKTESYGRNAANSVFALGAVA
jgi:DNA-binding NarL/FixJ family response regulator